ncbi:MAG: MBL fold metallo-hydrolase [Lachnospiraceae bacterium]|nr:MBL fold metallo-hydrolase [Lachnospiraceae bacterium]
MRITFLGATHEVTGSCCYVEGAGKRFLIDYGMEQGPNTFENEALPIPASELDFILLTHAHIDHSGNLPILYAKGFRGPIYATPATSALCNIMLKDSAHIQMFEAEWRNRKGQRAGKKAFIPDYTMADAIGAISLLNPCPYQETISICEGIRIHFVDAGHLLGSSSIEVWVREPDNAGEEVEKKLVFSGDIGNLNQPLIKDPTYLTEADYVIMESTYGNRNHEHVPIDYPASLAAVIQRTFDRGGNVVIPSFAVGRTQELLYFIRQIKTQNLVHGHDNFQVVIDSPLAMEATEIFQSHYKECYDEEAKALIEAGINPISFTGLKRAVTSDESKQINFDKSCKVIISASGMCDAGRIKHHLKHNLWRKECTILFVGYQAVGTLGRALLEGTDEVKLFGEPIRVNAEILQLPGISGHADQDGLLKWASSFTAKPDVPKPTQFFIVHGEDQSAVDFASLIEEKLGCPAMAPFSGTIYDLEKERFIKVTNGIRIMKPEDMEAIPGRTSQKSFSIYQRLLAAGQRLLTVIKHNEGGTNKDLARFADQINSLCDKWDR